MTKINIKENNNEEVGIFDFNVGSFYLLEGELAQLVIFEDDCDYSYTFVDISTGNQSKAVTRFLNNEGYSFPITLETLREALSTSSITSVKEVSVTFERGSYDE